MTSRAPVGPWVSVVACLSAIVAGTWWWRGRVYHAEQGQPAAAPWKHVQEHYPIPPELTEAQRLSPAIFEAIIAANPFSAARRLAPPSNTSAPDGGPTAVTAPPKPQFAYKGLIKFGNRQRAILEDAATRKTHFLEVGQEVAGFKVLDIAENRVVLSDPQTKEELVVSIASKASP